MIRGGESIGILLKLIAAIVIAVLTYGLVNSRHQDRLKAGLSSLIVLVTIFLLTASFHLIPGGHVGVVFNIFSGIAPETLKPSGSGGLVFVLPVINTVEDVEVRTQEYTMSGKHDEGELTGDDSLWSPTSDGLQVGLDVTVFYHPDPKEAANLLRTVGSGYREKIVRPEVRNTVRMVVSQYDATEVYSGKRQQIQEEIKEKLGKQLDKYNIILDDILLRDVRFTPEYAQAITKKKIAEQQAEQMKYVLQKEAQEAEKKRIAAKGQADKEFIEAQGKAKAMNEIARALAQNPQLLKYEAIQKLNPNVKVILPNNTIVNLGDLLKDQQ